MKADAGFAEEIKKLLDDVQKDAASIHVAFDQRGQIVGTQTNIGNVHGAVDIGTK